MVTNCLIRALSHTKLNFDRQRVCFSSKSQQSVLVLLTVCVTMGMAVIFCFVCSDDWKIDQVKSNRCIMDLLLC